jgi:transcriptional regulator with XRE-family HTH domain
MTKPLAKTESPVASARSGAKRGLDLISSAKKLGGVGSSRDRVDARAIEIGERIRAARLARGWTQSRLAKRVGCAQGDLSELERGRLGPQGPSYRSLTSIADALSIALPISPRSGGAPLVQADTVGDVRQAMADVCMVHALWTDEEWKNLRQYAASNFDLKAVVETNLSQYCTVFTLGSHASLRNLRSSEPLLVALVRGDGRFKFHRVKHHRQPRVNASMTGAVAILDLNGSMEVSAEGQTGLTMMMMPVQNLFNAGLDDELAC